jgi:hypothetical protein
VDLENPVVLVGLVVPWVRPVLEVQKILVGHLDLVALEELGVTDLNLQGNSNDVFL